MELNGYEQVSPFDAFRTVIKLLTWTGIYEINSQYKTVRAAHYVYRILVICLAVINCIQHFVHVYKISDNKDELFLALILSIPITDLIVKMYFIFINMPRINKLHEQIKDPIFMPSNPKDAEFLLRNNSFMNKLTKYANLTMLLGFTLYVCSTIFSRISDPEFKFPSYMPFNTDTMVGFGIAVFLDNIESIWTGYGQYSADCVIATYYAHATVQLKILKYNLVRVFDYPYEKRNNMFINRHLHYKDELDPNLKRRFDLCTEKYRKLIWFVKDVDSVFDINMTFQFFTASANLCFVSSFLSELNIFSARFVSMLIVALLFASQVYLYCYFGHQVGYECQSMNTAIYFSDWMSVSPRLRRNIITAMTAWNKPISPRVSHIMPVSLVTFVSIMRFTYSLYTLLKSKA